MILHFFYKNKIKIMFLYTDKMLSKNRQNVIEEPTKCYRRTDILLLINPETSWRSKGHLRAKYILNIY